MSFAEFAGAPPNWILPLTPPGHNGTPNTDQFSYLMWRPLYWQGTGTSPAIDYSTSLAQKPVYSDNDKVVTVHLNDFNWSDGTPVTSRDVEFFLNLVKYDPSEWAEYVKGNIPDSISSFKIVNPKTFQLTLKSSVSPQWFTENQLTLIIPMPQQAWDKTSTSAKVGNYDESSAGAKSVVKYLTSQSSKTTSYASNPLWQTVDGPWKITQYTSTAQITLTANSSYTGPDKPSFKNFEEIPFTTDTAEFNSLLAGDVDYGYIPFSDLKEMSRVKSLGYHPEDWNTWGDNYMALNYTNPATGPIFKQLYIRQALESMVDQPAIIQNLFQGQGVQNFSAIPTEPANSYSNVKSNPYPYDPSKAVSLLKSHGWDVKPSGKTTCASAGTAANQCGAGIKPGEALSFSVDVNSGNSPVMLEMQALQSQWSQTAGVKLAVNGQPFSQVISEAFAACTSSSSSCWQSANWGGGISLLPYPTGEQVFASTGADNAGRYDNPKVDQMINTTHTQGAAALAAYNTYTTAQEPELFLPMLSYQVSMIRNSLKGADNQNPYTALNPEEWARG